jgi:hypothetical protein
VENSGIDANYYLGMFQQTRSFAKLPAKASDPSIGTEVKRPKRIRAKQIYAVSGQDHLKISGQ